MSLLDECVAAHGGMETWRALDELGLTVRALGLAFVSCGQNRLFDGVTATAAARGQHVVLDEIAGGRDRPYGAPVAAATLAARGRGRVRRGCALDLRHVPVHLVGDAVDVDELSGRRPPTSCSSTGSSALSRPACGGW